MSTTNILDLNNRIDELADSYPAAKVMLSNGVTSVEDALEANNLDTEVEVTSYTTTKYVAPSDGYLQLAATSTTTTNITAYIYGADETKLFVLSATYNRINSFNAIFVKKGMKISIILNQNNGNAFFFPLK